MIDILLFLQSVCLNKGKQKYLLYLLQSVSENCLVFILSAVSEQFLSKIEMELSVLNWYFVKHLQYLP